MQGLNWQPWTMRFVAGLNQKADPRTLEPPELVVLKDAQFDEVGGLQTRFPFGAAETDIFGGGTISNARRIVANGDERLLFTKTQLYSRNVQDAKWLLRGEHLAIAVDQTPVFQTTEEQVDAERAELNGTIVYAWTVSLSGGSKTYVAAKDATTGAIKLSPTALAGNAVLPRLVALETKILLFFADGLGNLLAYALDPANPGAALGGASTTILAAAFNNNYDVCKQPGSDAAFVAMRRSPTTSYQVANVTAALAVTSSTKARACSGAIAIAWHVSQSRLLVVRDDSATIRGDILDGSLADVSTGTSIGVAGFPVRNITCAWQQSTTTAWVFWDDNGATFSSVFRNSITTAAAVGTTARTNYATIAASAFSHDGRVYVWMATDQTSSSTTVAGVSIFVAAVENCYLLYRDDGVPFAKAAFLRAGGRPGAGHLPGVESPATNKYAWCGLEMRLVPTGVTSLPTYADRNPVDIVVEFDTDRARRVARSGNTLYITSGLGLLQYDGVGLTEVGFLQFPFAFTLADGGAGTMAAGGYSYLSTLRWQNAVGESDRSTTATIKGITQIASKEVDITFDHFDHTLKRSPRANMAIEFWRTIADAPQDSAFRRVTGSDPSVTTGDNCYLENVPGTTATTFTDSFTDAELKAKESNPENGDVLESVSPPPATLIAATDTRVFIAGIAGDPDRVWYSKQRNAGEVAAFNDGLAVAIPAPGGRLTGLALLFGRVPIVFREKAAYRLDGDGVDNAGAGQNYSAERIPGDVGAVNQESIAVTERGVIFKSSKGWYLTNGQSMQYIGAPIADYDGETPLAVDVMESQHQVRVLTSSRMLMLDTYVSDANQRPTWAEWTVAGGVHSCIWNGAHVYLTSTGPRTQLTTYTGVDYGIDLETAWIKLNDLLGFGRVRWFQTLGEYRSAHKLRVRVAMDYAPTFIDDHPWTPTPTVVGGPELVQHGPSEQQMSAIKVALTAIGESGVGAPSADALRLTGLTFLLGLKPGLRKLPALQKQ